MHPWGSELHQVTGIYNPKYMIPGAFWKSVWRKCWMPESFSNSTTEVPDLWALRLDPTSQVTPGEAETPSCSFTCRSWHLGVLIWAEFCLPSQGCEALQFQMKWDSYLHLLNIVFWGGGWRVQSHPFGCGRSGRSWKVPGGNCKTGGRQQHAVHGKVCWKCPKSYPLLWVLQCIYEMSLC